MRWAAPIDKTRKLRPLRSGINRPSGNLTGVDILTTGLESKRLQLLGKLVPASALIAVLINPKAAAGESQEKDLQEAASSLGRPILILNPSSELSKLGQSRVIQTSSARSLPRSRRRGGARLKAMLS